MKQFILSLPEGTSSDSFSDEVAEAIRAVRGQFPSGVVVGSQASNGYELKLVMANADKESLENSFFLLGLDWAVLAEEGVQIDESLILPFMADTPLFDEDGEQVGFKAMENLSSLQTYAGKKWTL